MVGQRAVGWTVCCSLGGRQQRRWPVGTQPLGCHVYQYFAAACCPERRDLYNTGCTIAFQGIACLAGAPSVFQQGWLHAQLQQQQLLLLLQAALAGCVARVARRQRMLTSSVERIPYCLACGLVFRVVAGAF